MSPKDWLEHATEQLKKAGINSARLDGQMLLEHVTQRDRASISIDETPLDQTILQQLSDLLEKRTSRVPLAYLLKSREFYGLQFDVTNDVLVPRPETETLVTYASEHAPNNAQILELGTGSGAIAISLQSIRSDAVITATDISKAALAVATRNAVSLVSKPISFVESDLFDAIDGRFDVVLANLPYVPEGARRQPEITYEPDVALYGGDDGLYYYDRFFAALEDYLTDGGFALIEFSPTQFPTATKRYKAFSLEPISEYIYAVTRA